MVLNSLAAAAQIVMDKEQKWWKKSHPFNVQKLIPILLPHLDIFLMFSDWMD